MCLQAESKVEQGGKGMPGVHTDTALLNRHPYQKQLVNCCLRGDNCRHDCHSGQIYIGVDCSGFTTESLPSEQIVEAANVLEVIIDIRVIFYRPSQVLQISTL